MTQLCPAFEIKKIMSLAPLQNLKKRLFFPLLRQSLPISRIRGFLCRFCTEQIYDGFSVDKGHFGHDPTCISNDLGPFAVEIFATLFGFRKLLRIVLSRLIVFSLWIYQNCFLRNDARLFSVTLILTRGQWREF